MAGDSDIDMANFKAEADLLQVENDPTLEHAWATKAIEHMEIHFNILCSVDPKLIKLTAHDDEIYQKFKEEFPEFNLDCIDIGSLKSEEAKKKWVSFFTNYKDMFQDPNFGTLVRIDSRKDYSSENTIFVLRFQFLAIEIARNREGFNDSIRKNYQASRN